MTHPVENILVVVSYMFLFFKVHPFAVLTRSKHKSEFVSVGVAWNGFLYEIKTIKVPSFEEQHKIIECFTPGGNFDKEKHVVDDNMFTYSIL